MKINLIIAAILAASVIGGCQNTNTAPAAECSVPVERSAVFICMNNDGGECDLVARDSNRHFSVSVDQIGFAPEKDDLLMVGWNNGGTELCELCGSDSCADVIADDTFVSASYFGHKMDTPEVSVDRLEDNNMVVLEVVHGANEIDTVDVPEAMFVERPYAGKWLNIYNAECVCCFSDEYLYEFIREDGNVWDIEPEYGGVFCWHAWENPVAGEFFTGWFYDNGTDSVEDDVLVFVEG